MLDEVGAAVEVASNWIIDCNIPSPLEYKWKLNSLCMEMGEKDEFPVRADSLKSNITNAAFRMYMQANNHLYFYLST